MADLAQSAVTFNRMWTEGGTNGLDHSCRQVTLVLVGHGIITAGKRIPATVLGLSKIEQSTSFVSSDSLTVMVGSPSYDGAYLLLAEDPVGINSPVETTGTFRGVVKGLL